MTRPACPPKLQRRRVFITNRHPRLRLSRHAIARAVGLLDEQFLRSPLERGLSAIGSATADGAKRRGVSAVPPGELSIVFLTDPALARIHADFMGDPTATDVITFEGDKAAGLAGEICVSADTAWKYVESVLAPTSRTRAPQAATLQQSFSAELTLYLIHGWLHLAGYDDLKPAKKRRMRAAEARAMKLLREAGAIPEFRLG